MPVQLHDSEVVLSEALRTTAERIPTDGITIHDLFELIGEQGLLLFCAFLSIPFLLPVSIPGVSTVFGLLIVLIGVGVTLNRVPWLPQRLMNRRLAAKDLVPVLERGSKVVHRIDSMIRPRWLPLTHGNTINRINGVVLVFAAILLMAPFALIPFSNTLPALACLCLSAGMLQRDGLFVVFGYLLSLATTVYFGALFFGALAAGESIRALLAG
jgi:hypothetical protein